MSTPFTISVGDGQHDPYNGIYANPMWLLSVVSFRDPSPIDADAFNGNVSIDKKKGNLINSTETKNVIPITSDCISLSISQSKSNNNPTLNATLMAGNYNYLATIFPGDYITANIKHTSEGIAELAQRAMSGQSINRVHDGFKGVFRVTSVRQVSVILEGAHRRIVYQVTAQAFTEFNTQIYFDANLVPSNPSISLYDQTTYGVRAKFRGDYSYSSVQDIISDLLELSLGMGPKTVAKLGATPNTLYRVSSALASLMGMPGVVSFRQFYRYFFGIQTFANSGSVESTNPVGTLPKITRGGTSSSLYNTGVPVQGTTTRQSEYWNCVVAWTILKQYVNSPINEMFLSFRTVDENGGVVLPVLTLRQIPFTSNKFANENKDIKTTPFLSLPRWKIDPSLIRSVNIGRDDAPRTNFIQVFGIQQNVANPENIVANQSALKQNIALDKSDIERSGLRPQIITTGFSSIKGDARHTSQWTKLIADAVIGSQMKLSGSIECFGIEEEIAIGDNLELDGIVYHIEGINHQCSINDGKKDFTTVILLSSGVDVNSDNDFKVYGYSIVSDYATSQSFDKDGVLPTVTNDTPNTEGNDKEKFNVKSIQGVGIDVLKGSGIV